jgi:hypothetical protein
MVAISTKSGIIQPSNQKGNKMPSAYRTKSTETVTLTLTASELEFLAEGLEAISELDEADMAGCDAITARILSFLPADSIWNPTRKG